MKRETIKKLKCINCDSDFQIVYSPDIDGLAGTSDEINYCILGCKCSEYPVAGGILYLKKDKEAQQAMDVIRNSRSLNSIKRAILPLINQKFVRFVVWLQMFLGKKLSFWKLATFIEDSRWVTYLKYRFSCPGFISGLPFIPVIKEASGGGLVLDLACGAGHYSFILSRQIEQNRIICADKSFLNLYFARNYLVGEDAEFICLNADEQIPLKEGSVSTIVSMDALQFIDKKEPVAKEMIRILQANGLIVFIHLHNLNVQCPAFGKPLTPEGYASLFPGFGAKYFDEKTLVDHVLKRAGLDISAGNTPEKVKDAEAISIVLTKDHAFFKKYPPYDVLSNVKAPDKIMLNPIFMRVGDEYLLRFPSERYEVEYWMAKDIFPAKVKAGASEKELRERFIFIPAPENYMNKGERLYRFRLWR